MKEIVESARQRQRFRRYSEYKRSDVEWLGDLPAHWRPMRFKFGCSRSALYGANESAESYSLEGIRFLRTTDIDDSGSLVDDVAVYLPEQLVQEYLLSDGDILISRSGTLGRALHYQSDLHGPCAYAGYLVRFVPKPTLDSRFAFHFTKSHAFTGWLSVTAIQSTIGNINGQKYGNLHLPNPTFGEQRTIADFLDRETTRIDQLIEKKQRMVDVFEEREEATFLGFVTGLKSDGPKKTSGVEWMGSIPAYWQAPKFTQVCRQETGHTPSRKVASYWVPEECVIPWFSLSDVWQIRQDGRVFVSETSEKISQIGMEKSSARLLPTDTVILSRTASVGFPAILSVPMATTQDFVGWICSDQVLPKYLYYVLRAMKSEFQRLMMGSTHQTIYMPDIRSFRTPLPPIAEQHQIVNELDEITGRFQSAAAKIKSSIDRLREFRAALITAAVTGQIDVSTCGKQGTSDRRLDQIEEATST